MSSRQIALGPNTNDNMLILTEHSACIASILRTYYTWQTVEALDTSWELLPMGYWTWTELSIGIIVGCLPTMPKFFQHIGPKLCRRVLGTAPEHGSSAEADTPNGHVLARFQRPFAKYGVGLSVYEERNESYITCKQPRSEYVVLDEVDTSSRKGSGSSGETEYQGKAIATVREDVEYGRDGT